MRAFSWKVEWKFTSEKAKQVYSFSLLKTLLKLQWKETFLELQKIAYYLQTSSGMRYVISQRLVNFKS